MLESTSWEETEKDNFLENTKCYRLKKQNSTHEFPNHRFSKTQTKQSYKTKQDHISMASHQQMAVDGVQGPVSMDCGVLC